METRDPSKMSRVLVSRPRENVHPVGVHPVGVHIAKPPSYHACGRRSHLFPTSHTPSRPVAQERRYVRLVWSRRRYGPRRCTIRLRGTVIPRNWAYLASVYQKRPEMRISGAPGNPVYPHVLPLPAVARHGTAGDGGRRRTGRRSAGRFSEVVGDQIHPQLGASWRVPHVVCQVGFVLLF